MITSRLLRSIKEVSLRYIKYEFLNAVNNTEKTKSINEILEQRMEKIIPHLKGEKIEDDNK